ncbi:MAG: hypothetical protein WC364_10755 [Eubacteriales bacterium]|jgi:hypothetical protein
MVFDIDIMKKELFELDERQFYIKYIVKTMNWYFSTYMKFNDTAMLDALDHFKEIVSDNLLVSFHSAHIVGSAKIGYSLSPRKPFKPFHEENGSSSSSDIDVAIISTQLFNKFWQRLRQTYKTQYIANYERITSTIFQGYINETDITSISVIRSEWAELFSPITKGLQDELNIIHPITYRIYRSWEDLEQYQISGLIKLKQKLGA